MGATWGISTSDFCKTSTFWNLRFFFYSSLSHVLSHSFSSVILIPGNNNNENDDCGLGLVASMLDVGVKTRPRNSSGTSSYNIIFFLFYHMSHLCYWLANNPEAGELLVCVSAQKNWSNGVTHSLTGIDTQPRGGGEKHVEVIRESSIFLFSSFNPITPSTETAGVASEAVYSRWSGGSNMQFASLLC